MDAPIVPGDARLSSVLLGGPTVASLVHRVPWLLFLHCLCLCGDLHRYDTPIQPGNSLGTITICYNWSPGTRVAPFAKSATAVLDLSADMQVGPTFTHSITLVHPQPHPSCTLSLSVNGAWTHNLLACSTSFDGAGTVELHPQPPPTCPSQPWFSCMLMLRCPPQTSAAWRCTHPGPWGYGTPVDGLCGTKPPSLTLVGAKLPPPPPTPPHPLFASHLAPTPLCTYQPHLSHVLWTSACPLCSQAAPWEGMSYSWTPSGAPPCMPVSPVRMPRGT